MGVDAFMGNLVIYMPCGASHVHVCVNQAVNMHRTTDSSTRCTQRAISITADIDTWILPSQVAKLPQLFVEGDDYFTLATP